MASDLEKLLSFSIQQRKARRWRLVAILSILILAVVVFAQARDDTRREDYIARVSLDGIIMEDTFMEEVFNTVAEDKHAKALLVRISSPGGTTYGAESVYADLKRISADKPVVAVVGSLAASGGYIAALGTDRIFARESSLTGSIGVLMQSMEVTGLLEKLGIKSQMFKSSPLKAAPNPFEELTDAQRVATEESIGVAYDWFVGLVRDRRHLTGAALDRVTDGRVFTGSQALDLGLIDALGGERDARQWLAENRDINTDLPVYDVDMRPEEENILELIGQISGLKQQFNGYLKPVTLDGLVSLWHP